MLRRAERAMVLGVRPSMLRRAERAMVRVGYQCSEEQRQPRRRQATNAPKSKESLGAARLSILRRAKRAMVLGVRRSMLRGAVRAMVLGAGVNQCSEKQREPRGGNLR